MIIFAGIVASIPDMVKGIYVDYFVNVPSSRLTSSLIFVAILIIAVLLIVYFTTYVEQAKYKIPNSVYKGSSRCAVKLLSSIED